MGGAAGPVRVIPFGRLTYEPDSAPVTAHTLYDLASLTKVVATTSAAMVLVDERRLSLETRLSSYLDVFADGAKSQVTAWHLLTHSSGLPRWAPLYREVRGKEAVVRRAAEMELEYAPGARSQYGDLGLLLMGDLIERVSGQPLQSFVDARVLAPIGMRATVFRPGVGRDSLAPTEEDRWRGRLLWGEVHDENAYAMGGVAGHAGLFGTAGDLALFAQVMLNEGRLGSSQWVSRATVREFTRRAGVPGSSRALGWDTPGTDPFLGASWSGSSYGHTGLTGTLMWVDPERDIFVVLLTNRVYPTRENDAFSEVRRQVCERLLSGR